MGMKNKHIIEAYKLHAFPKTGEDKNSKKTPSQKANSRGDGSASGEESSASLKTGQQEEKPSERTAAQTPQGMKRGEIFRGSSINSILNTDGFLKTGFGHKKAAKLLLLLGKDQASSVLKHLSQEEIEKVSAEIAKIKRIEKTESEKILEEFGALAGKIAATPRGGLQVARDMLTTSFSEEEAERILKKVGPYSDQRPFSFLYELDYQQIMLLLRREPVHVISIVVSYLKPNKASQVLESLPPEAQAQVVKRIARLGRISPEVLSSIEESLRERIRTQGKVVVDEIDGQSVLADILKHMEIGDENRILEALRENHGDLAEEIRERLFTFESILDIPDVQLQTVLHKYPDRDLAAIIKGKSPELEEKVLSNVSERRRDFIQDERQNLGPMKRSEVDKITKDFLSHIRQQVEEGEITLETDELV